MTAPKNLNRLGVWGKEVSRKTGNHLIKLPSFSQKTRFENLKMRKAQFLEVRS
jgi:hypothetical protein